MTGAGHMAVECKHNLTITVPPIGLELVDTDGDELLQNNGLLKIAEREKKTIVCKTNAPTKPAVDLEWMIPEGLNVSANSSINVQDVSDKRLSVPVLTLSFTSNVHDEIIVLVCRVAINSSFDDIQASIYIENEGELTTNSRHLWTTCKDIHTLTASNGEMQEPKEEPWYKQIRLVVPGCSAVVMLLMVLASVGAIIHCRKRAVEGSAASAIQNTGNLPDDETSHTGKPTSTSGVRSLELNFDQSDIRNAIPSVPEVPHTYMAMKPILNCRSSAGTRQQVSYPATSVDDLGDAVLYVSPTLVRKQVKTHSNLKEEPTYVNTKGASTYCEINTDIPDIVKYHTNGLDDLFTTYL